jgi:hypothetical protein
VQYDGYERWPVLVVKDGDPEHRWYATDEFGVQIEHEEDMEILYRDAVEIEKGRDIMRKELARLDALWSASLVKPLEEKSSSTL